MYSEQPAPIICLEFDVSFLQQPKLAHLGV